MARWCVSPSARKTGTNPPERNARATSLRREALGSRALAAWLAAAAMLSPGEGAAATPPGLAGAQTDAEAELERALEGAATLRGDAYLRARDLLVQRHATRLPARVAAARWSAASWRSDAAAALALAAYQRSAPDPHEEVPPGGPERCAPP